MHTHYSSAGLLLILNSYSQNVHVQPTVAVPPSTGADTLLSDVTAPTTIAAEALHDHVAAVCNIIMESLCSCDGGGWKKKFLLLPCNNQHAV